MPQSLASVNLHLVFSTKERLPLLPESLSARLYEYIGGTLRAENCALLAAGGMPDHVHLLVSLSREITIAELLRIVKSSSSKWLHENGQTEFGWQAGNGVFSVSESNVGVVKAYIARQKEHHRVMSFQEEFIGFLKKHGLSYDERYVWG